MSLTKVSLDWPTDRRRRTQPAVRRLLLFRPRPQVLHWRVDEPYSDTGAHLHLRGDEVYVVLEGAIDLDVDGVVTTCTAGEAAAVGAGVSHALAAVHFPARGLTVRGPAVDRQDGDRLGVPLRAP